MRLPVRRHPPGACPRTGGDHARSRPQPRLGVTEEGRRRYGQRAQPLAGASVTYLVVEAIIAVTAGVVAGSVALVGLGLNSIVEVPSGLIILWRFRNPCRSRVRGRRCG